MPRDDRLESQYCSDSRFVAMDTTFGDKVLESWATPRNGLQWNKPYNYETSSKKQNGDNKPEDIMSLNGGHHFLRL